MVSFILLIHFLVAEDYELPKNTSHILSVPLMSEYQLDPCLFFYFICLPNDVMFSIAI